MFAQDDNTAGGSSDQPMNGVNDVVADDTMGAAPLSDNSEPSDNDDLITPAVPPADGSPAVNDDLVAIKQQALQQLSPLVMHLDQSPEEKFRTLMMMIQASDDQKLIKDAYAAAKDISDEKARAQAFLDIVNEINYFTQNDTN